MTLVGTNREKTGILKPYGKDKRRLRQMIKLTGLNKEEVEAISKQIADAFYDYKYNEADLGLVKYIRSREDMFTENE